MALTIPDFGDPQALIDSIDEDMSSTDLIKLQLQIGLLMMRITAISGIVKSICETEQGIARNFG